MQGYVAEAVAPSADAVKVTSLVDCDVGGIGGCIAPCGVACEDHEEVLDHMGQDYSGHPFPWDIRLLGVVSFVFPFVFGCRTIPEQPLFLARGCRQDW